MVLYSSSPPATWTTPYSMSSKASAMVDMDIHFQTHPLQQHHHHHHHSSSRPPVKGGLSSLFSNNSSRPPHQPSSFSASDVLDSVGSPQGSSQSEVNCGLRPSEGLDSRSVAVNIPKSSSFKFKERSPVSVIQGPVACSSNYGSPLSAWESAGTSIGISQVERGPRRRSSFSDVAERRPVSRSLGFEVGNNSSSSSSRSISRSISISSRGDHYHQSSLKGCRTVDPRTVLSSSAPLRVEGFDSGARHSKMGISSTLQSEAPGMMEAREEILSLADHVNGVSSANMEEALISSKSAPMSAEELLNYAQAKHKVFYDPCVVKAFRMAEKAHNGQVRRNGDLYLAHCVETAIILAAAGVGSTVAAGLLHDALDDSNLSLQSLRAALGEDVASLIVGVSKVSQFSALARDNQTVCDPLEADRLRTMILAMVDVRVVLIKIADRLHNMRTLKALPPCKQVGIAKETLEIYAPLANRLGVWSWKAELEDLGFECLNPVEHQELSLKLSEQCEEEVVMSSIKELHKALQVQGVRCIDLSGRPKNLYSIYKKMMKKGKSVEDILDVRGLRLVVPDEKSCYTALEVVRQLWKHIAGKFKDYIVEPKCNGYKSLHVVVIGSDGYPLEVQIRTKEMHHQAEYGLAAHWRYKEDNTEHSAFSLERVEWARWVLTWHSEILDTKLRVSPMGPDLRPPCPFPVHSSDCPYALSCSGPPLKEDDPVLIIKVENDKMVVQELPSNSTVRDLVSRKMLDVDFSPVNGSSSSWEEPTVKVNHQLVENLEQKLKMGDFVEVIKIPGTIITESSPVHLSAEERIAIEFQREQLKRLYLEGGNLTKELRTTSAGLARELVAENNVYLEMRY